MRIRHVFIGLGLIAAAAYAGFRRRLADIASRPGVPLQSIDLGEVTDHVIETVDGAHIHVHEMGNRNGPTIVFLHGVVLQWWLWNAVSQHLVADHHVLAWDMRGHGDSTVGSFGMTIAAAAADLAEVLEHLDVTEATIVGYSMGGMVLGRLAGDRPDLLGDRIAGLVFVATTAAPAAMTPGATGSERVGIGAGRVIDATERHYLIDPLKMPGRLPAVALSYTNFGPNPTAAALADLRFLASTMAPGVTADSFRSMALLDVRNDLGAINVPTLVLGASYDRLATPAQSRLLARRIPGARLKILADVGHALVVERPEAVASEVREFVATLPKVRP